MKFVKEKLHFHIFNPIKQDIVNNLYGDQYIGSRIKVTALMLSKLSAVDQYIDSINRHAIIVWGRERGVR